MNRESIIKEFEEKQKDDARVYFEHCEHYTDEFVEWLLSKVIAQGEDNERLKPEKGGLRPDEYMHEWMEQDAVGFDLPPEEIIEHLCRDNRLLQEKYDKLKQRIDDAPSDILVMDEFMAGIELCLATQALIKRTNLEGKTVALVELPEEMDGKK